MPLFDNFLTKLSQVNLSDLNHELGKAKENLQTAYESGNYIGNFKSDASHVGTLIRSESTRFSSILGGAKTRGPPSLPKSASLPVIQDEVREAGSSPTDSVRLRKNIGNKYKYRSSYCEQDTEISSPDNGLEQEDSVNTFIKEVGAGKEQELSGRSKPLSSREDIRKKLASFGEETIQEEDWSEAGTNNNLEICFINETASDEEEDQVIINPLQCHSDEETGSNQESVLIPRSKSCRTFTSPHDLQQTGKDIEAENSRVEAALAGCRQVAQRQLAVERQRRSAEDPLRKLLGVSSDDLSPSLLSSYNVNTLQVILNDFREKIEQHSTELVSLLLQKDELETEQDSMLIDIEDISHSSVYN